MDIEIILLVLAILFFSTAIRATFGFGDALLAMPLLSIVAGIKIAVPIVALVAVIIAVSILYKTYRIINFREILPLILACIAGIPLGLLYLKDTNETIVKVVLAIILILFGFYRLIRPELLYLRSDRFAVVFGFISGVLGGAYNTNGPPIVIYGAMRRWEPSRFRSTLQGVFLPTNIFIATGHAVSGFWTTEVLTLFLICLPIVIIAIILGTILNKKIPTDNFVKYIDILLILIGFLLIYNTIF